MTDIDIQALRDFMAEKVMGWQKNSLTHCPYYIYPREDKVDGAILVSDWHPDLDSNQLDMLVDKMVGEEWSFKLGDNVPPPMYYCEFWKNIKGGLVEGRNYNPDRRLAVLLAIKAAKEGE